jgi:mono/diheme cytochrome c family protein
MAFSRVVLSVLLLLGTASRVAANGATLYRLHCARCHGPEGRGDGPEASTLVHRPRDLREGFLRQYTTDELVARVRRGEPLVLVLDAEALGRALVDIDAVTAHLRRLPGTDWSQYRLGREIFLARCAGCHGPAGEGGGPGTKPLRRAPDLGSPAARERLVGDRLLAAVRHALPGMPGIDQVPTEDDARALAAYVGLLSPGHRVYTTYCAGCHGEDGRVAEQAPADARPKVAFDAEYFRRLAPHELEDSATHMVLVARPRMPHLASTVRETEARSIIEYLKTLP